MAWPFRKKTQEPIDRSAYFSSETPLVSYWSLFDDKDAAEQAAERLRGLELSADVEASAGKKGSWLLLTYMPLPDSEDVVERHSEVVKSVVGSLGGEYDGWEAGPLPDEDTLHRIQSWLKAGIGAA